MDQGSVPAAPAHGLAVLDAPRPDKGAAFTRAERERRGLAGVYDRAAACRAHVLPGCRVRSADEGMPGKRSHGADT